MQSKSVSVLVLFWFTSLPLIFTFHFQNLLLRSLSSFLCQNEIFRVFGCCDDAKRNSIAERATMSLVCSVHTFFVFCLFIFLFQWISLLTLLLIELIWNKVCPRCTYLKATIDIVWLVDVVLLTYPLVGLVGLPFFSCIKGEGSELHIHMEKGKQTPSVVSDFDTEKPDFILDKSKSSISYPKYKKMSLSHSEWIIHWWFGLAVVPL